MKKILFTLLIGSSLTAWSQCETGVVANDTTICLGDTVTITAFGPGTPLTTTFVGGNNHRGNMFDIVALSTVTIESFDGHPMGDTDYEIYYKTGTFVGSETNAAAWTLVGSAANVIAQPMGTPTAIPINIGVTIPAGQTYSFYVTSTNLAVSQNYTDGSAPGAVFASDANIQFLEGAGMEYPFGAGGSVFSPRIWNGNINYSIGTTYLWDMGATTSQIVETPTAQTTYLVDITPNGCPTSTDSVTIYINPAPILDLGADTSICPGTQITLDAGPGQASYDWNNGLSTAQTTSVLPGTSYFVEVTSIEGCFAYDTINVAMAPVPVVDLGMDTVVCEGSPATIDAGNVGSTYMWSTAETTQTIDVGGGTHTVTVTNSEGCSETDDITILENPMPIVSLGNDTTFCVNQMVVLDAGAGFSGYLWSTSDTTQTITVDGAIFGVGAHSISIEVTNNFGCTNTDDVVVNIDGCLGLIQVPVKHMEVYPNPTSNVLHVELDQLTIEPMLNVYSMDGLLVLSERMISQTQSLDLSRLERGSYILELSADDYKEIIKVIKN
ncbi:MAG: hypothetical protein ACJA1C_002599 [Crocinitomicaceae bacterium]|jgi:hypothetical protein